eukprot:CAMPEP_0179236650 /NCGR_PEP_ID=MMETSP0797-20121207/14036_1 /TAXON_ID=47934 /ORGANISM="Dinophysis acuminata, Strain DAEP01" /LENGTH=589 /DNA_ID=CAMNT_0020943911 /DNA_START=240 /DNA_END=2009 /DNA_ORIENTATION=+
MSRVGAGGEMMGTSAFDSFMPQGDLLSEPTEEEILQFFSVNHFDSAAELAFRQQPPNFQRRLMDDGPCEGTNSSAMLMSRIRRLAAAEQSLPAGLGGYSQGSISEQTLAEFIAVNELDGQAVRALNDVSEVVQRRVINEGIVTGKNKSAILIGRIRRCRNLVDNLVEGGPSRRVSADFSAPPPKISISGEIPTIEEFVLMHQLDEYAEKALRDQTPDVLQLVLAEGAITGDNKSKILMGRIRRAKHERQPPDSGGVPGAPPPPQAAPGVDRFISDNDLDALARREILALPHEKQLQVLAEGALSGEKKSAVVMGRIRRVQQGLGRQMAPPPLPMVPAAAPAAPAMVPFAPAPQAAGVCGEMFNPMCGQMFNPMYGQMCNQMCNPMNGMGGMGGMGGMNGMNGMNGMGGMNGFMMPQAGTVGYFPSACMPAFNACGSMQPQPAQMAVAPGGRGPESAVDLFCFQNGVDPSAIRQLKEQPLDVQEKVIQEGFLTGSNKSAVLMSRVRRIVSGLAAAPDPPPLGGPGAQGGNALADQVTTFAYENQLDAGATNLLREQSEHVQRMVLEEGPITGSNRSAILISRVRRIERSL